VVFQYGSPRSVPGARLQAEGRALRAKEFVTNGLPQEVLSRTLKAMEVHFTPEQEAQLSQMATKAGTNPERIVKDVLSRYLDDEVRFRAAVERGIAAADRGEFIEEEEMDARIERMFNP
jgi:predicted transcriptional regulator